VGLIHSDDGAAQLEDICQRINGRTIRALFQFIECFWSVTGKVIHQRTGGFIHFTPFGILHAERLNGGNYDCSTGIQRGACDIEGFGAVEDSHRAERAFEGAAIGMLAVFERFQGLFADGIGGHQPEDKAVIGLQQVFGGDADGVASNEGFAAAGGNPQADVGQAL